MTEQEFLISEDPAAMLALQFHYADRVRRGDSGWSLKVSDRKLRLFACACCRSVWHLLTDERNREAVEVAERFADEPSAINAYQLDKATWNQPELQARSMTAWAYVLYFVPASECAAAVLHNQQVQGVGNSVAQADLLREIIGNPFRLWVIGMGKRCQPAYESCAMDKGHGGQHNANLRRFEAAWFTPTVLAIAERCYDVRTQGGTLDAEGLAVLADALEDAGAEGEILTHLRGDGPHVRGCWVLDLLLGNE